MRVWLVVLALLLPSLHAAAQTAQADAAMEAALRDYSAVSGGWYVNKRCWFLTGEKREKFTRDLELINLALVRDLGRSDSLRDRQRAAQEATRRPPYNACGAEAEELVLSTSQHAGLWSEEIRKLLAEIARQQESQKESGAE